MDIENYLTGLIIGDALGTPLNSLSKGNIKANFKIINSYVDVWPAIKANPFKWRKPALYSAITQFSLITAFASSARRFNKKNLIELITLAPEIPNYDYRVFRHADHNFCNLILHLNDNLQNYEKNHFSAHILPIIGTFILANPEPEKISLINIFDFCLVFTDNLWNISIALIYSQIIQDIYKNKSKPQNFGQYALEIIIKLQSEIEKIFPEIFKKRISPDEITKILKHTKQLFIELKDKKDFSAANELLINFFNTHFKMHITRATIDHPLAVFALSALYIKHYSLAPEEIIFNTARNGGATQAICSTIISLATYLFGKEILNISLLNSLINKKQIFALSNLICNKKISQKNIIQFLQNEAALTKKEREEYNSKTKKLLKKGKINLKRKKNSTDKTNSLNKHVVESWTKLDKAKWKKEKERNKLIY